MWFFMAFVAGLILMIGKKLQIIILLFISKDLMFLHGDQFIYDPNYKACAAKQD